MRIYLSCLVLTVLFAADMSAQFVSSPGGNVNSGCYEARMHTPFNPAEINYAGDETIDITYYDLNIGLDYPSQQVGGSVLVMGRVVAASIDSIFLDVNTTLTVTAVTFDGSAVPFYHDSAERILIIHFGRTFSAGEIFSVVVYYYGTPATSGFGSFAWEQTDAGHPAIWTLSEPFGSRDWWPCKDTPADKADSADISITADAYYDAVSNGILVDVVDNGNGTKTWHWKERYPIAQYLISLALADYTYYPKYYRYSPTDSMLIANYVYPENFNSARNTINKTADMIAVFADKYGEYPFLREKYGHAEFNWGGAMEHQTVSSMGTWDEGTVAHELSHQWFGDQVTCRDWENIWLNEGFATFSEAVWFGTIGGESAYLAETLQKMEYARYAEGTLYVQNPFSVDEIFNYYRSYAKGSIVLHMLKGIVGDSLFYTSLQTYLADPNYSYGTAVTEDFQGVVESISGLDLGYFFQEWVYGEGYPDYAFSYSYEWISGDTYKVYANIQQTAGTNPSFFTMPVQLKIETGSGDTLVTVFNDQRVQQFELYIEGEPLNIVFDPGWLILRNEVVTGPAEDGTVSKSFELSQNYPNPFNGSSVIRFTLPQRETVSLKLYDVLGREVKTIVAQELGAGVYSYLIHSSDLASGTYVYRLQAGAYTEARKLVVLK